MPRGNPDGIEALNATRYGAYSIEGKSALEAAQYDNPHRGYDTSWVKQDPHRLVPVDVARELEQSGAIGKLHETVYSTVGVATTLAHSARMGRGDRRASCAPPGSTPSSSPPPEGPALAAAQRSPGSWSARGCRPCRSRP